MAKLKPKPFPNNLPQKARKRIRKLRERFEKRPINLRKAKM